MAKTMSRNDLRLKRHARVRNKISGTPECLISMHKSLMMLME